MTDPLVIRHAAATSGPQDAVMSLAAQARALTDDASLAHAPVGGSLRAPEGPMDAKHSVRLGALFDAAEERTA